MQQEYKVRNIPVNTADNRAVDNINKMVSDIKTEMKITDDVPPSPQDTPAEASKKEETPLENKAHNDDYDDRYPVNAAGERTIYTGATAVSYELRGRRHASMPVPVYKCRGAGKVVVDIVVNGNGYVLKAEVNKSKSNTEDPCIVEAAGHDAERTRFDTSSLAKQQGSITYIFRAQ
jgi:outer membrane biosynthesis protein TonB